MPTVEHWQCMLTFQDDQPWTPVGSAVRGQMWPHPVLWLANWLHPFLGEGVLRYPCGVQREVRSSLLCSPDQWNFSRGQYLRFWPVQCPYHEHICRSDLFQDLHSSMGIEPWFAPPSPAWLQQPCLYLLRGHWLICDRLYTEQEGRRMLPIWGPGNR